jgi:hypothetical protein
MHGRMPEFFVMQASLRRSLTIREEVMPPETKGRWHGCVIASEGMRQHVSGASLRTNVFVPNPGRLVGG